MTSGVRGVARQHGEVLLDRVRGVAVVIGSPAFASLAPLALVTVVLV